jgi:hypothetical protein
MYMNIFFGKFFRIIIFQVLKYHRKENKRGKNLGIYFCLGSSKKFSKGKEKKRKISIPPLIELSAENNGTVPTSTVNEKVSR